jgi:hypothetical protein
LQKRAAPPTHDATWSIEKSGTAKKFVFFARFCRVLIKNDSAGQKREINETSKSEYPGYSRL